MMGNRSDDNSRDAAVKANGSRRTRDGGQCEFEVAGEVFGVEFSEGGEGFALRAAEARMEAEKDHDRQSSHFTINEGAY